MNHNIINNQDFLQVTTPQERVCFQPDRFEMLIDCKDVIPQDIHCLVNNQFVEITARQKGGEIVGLSQKKTECQISNRYHMPRDIIPETSQCFLSSEGLLYISGMWRNY